MMMTKKRIIIFESCTPTLTNASPFALLRTICQGLLHSSDLQAFKGATGKKTFEASRGCRQSKNIFRAFGKMCRATFGKPSGSLTVGQGLDIHTEREDRHLNTDNETHTDKKFYLRAVRLSVLLRRSSSRPRGRSQVSRHHFAFPPPRHPLTDPNPNRHPPRIQSCRCHHQADAQCWSSSTEYLRLPHGHTQRENCLLVTSRAIEASSIPNDVPKSSRVCSLANETLR